MKRANACEHSSDRGRLAALVRRQHECYPYRVPLVRLANADELDDVLALDRACMGACHWRLDEDNAVFVVEADDARICAYASVRLLDDEPLDADHGAAYFDRAGVAPYARGRGLQRLLIRARERWCRARGVAVAITYTVPTNTPSANNLIRCGWRLYRPAHAWGGLESLYWRRVLTRPRLVAPASAG